MKTSITAKGLRSATLIFLMIMCFTLHANAQNPSCGAVITTNTTLTADMDCSSYNGPAITIGADNVTLDLNGHTITQADGQNGVVVAGGVSHVTITSSQPGGKINGTGDAITFGSCSDVTISNLDLSLPVGNTTNSGNGIANYYSNINGLTIENVTIQRRSFGVRLYSSGNTSGIEITNSSFDNNLFGISLRNINGVNLSIISAQNNNNCAVMFENLSGTIEIDGVNVGGSAVGLQLGDQNSSFPTLVPGMFDGFGTNSEASIYLGGSSSNISLDGIDLSWTGATKTGMGLVSFWGQVNHLSIDNVKINNRYYGFIFEAGVISSDVNITNSNIDQNEWGLRLSNINGLGLSSLSVQNNSVGVNLGKISGDVSISGVNVAGSSIGIRFADQPAGFPTVVPGMFDGFGSTPTSIWLNGLTTELSISGVDLSWTKDDTKNGYGIYIEGTEKLIVDNVKASNRGVGLYSGSFYGQSSNIEIKNSFFDGNNAGMSLYNFIGLILTDISVQNNSDYGVKFSKIEGAIYVYDVNVAGSANGVVIEDQPEGFQIEPGMFSGFGTNYSSSIALYGITSSDITISGIDVSWTGSTTPTGYGILVPSGSAVNNLIIEDVISNNRDYGIHIYSHNSGSQTMNLLIKNSNFDDNNTGLSLYKINGLNLNNLSSQDNNSIGIKMSRIAGGVYISGVNVTGSANGVVIEDQPEGFNIIPGMFAGFGTNYSSSIALYGITSSDITVSELNLSWTGNTTPTGYGILVPSGSAVNRLTIDDVTANNRDRGIHIYSHNSGSQSTDVEIKNSNFDANKTGIWLDKINGVNLFDLSAQNNTEMGVGVSSLDGTISIANVNISGSANGVTIADEITGFHLIPGMFTGFGSNYYSALQLWGGVDITISDLDVSWTGSSTPTGIGIIIPSGSAVNTLLVDNVVSSNRDRGFHLYSYNGSQKSYNVEITHSSFLNNTVGLGLHNVENVNLHDNDVVGNSSSLELSSVINFTIYHNNICGGSSYKVIGDQAYELWNHTTLQGNYWCQPCSVGGFIPGVTSNLLEIKDDYAFGTQDGWLLPANNPAAHPCSDKPVAFCTDVTVYAGTACTAAADINNNSYDPDGDPFSLVQDPPGPYTVGVTDVTLMATDDHSATASCIARVTVVDNTPPTVVTQNITVSLDANGQATITASQIDNSSSDNCGIASISLDKTSFGCSSVGTNIVTLTVVDVNGNSNSAPATVTVQDITAPTVITKPASVTLVNGSANITASDVNNSSSDACGIASMSVSPNTFDCSMIGDNTVTLSVTDVNGNTASNTAVVTVNGIIPTVTATANPEYFVYPGGNKHTKYIGWGQQSITLNANGAATYSWSPSDGLNCTNCASPTASPASTTTYTVTGTNEYGCLSTASVTITVVDIQCGNGGSDIIICHKCNNNNTICLSPNAVQAHLNHGDYLGPCTPPKRTEYVVQAEQITLDQNYPNPFGGAALAGNPSTTIRYSIPEDVHVTLKVYDMYSREVATLVDVTQKAGMYTVAFDAKDLPSGVYTYRLESEGTIVSRVMTLVK